MVLFSLFRSNNSIEVAEPVNPTGMRQWFRDIWYLKAPKFFLQFLFQTLDLACHTQNAFWACLWTWTSPLASCGSRAMPLWVHTLSCGHALTHTEAYTQPEAAAAAAMGSTVQWCIPVQASKQPVDATLCPYSQHWAVRSPVTHNLHPRRTNTIASSVLLHLQRMHSPSHCTDTYSTRGFVTHTQATLCLL